MLKEHGRFCSDCGTELRGEIPNTSESSADVSIDQSRDLSIPIYPDNEVANAPIENVDDVDDNVFVADLGRSNDADIDNIDDDVFVADLGGSNEAQLSSSNSSDEKLGKTFLTLLYIEGMQGNMQQIKHYYVG